MKKLVMFLSLLFFVTNISQAFAATSHKAIARPMKVSPGLNETAVIQYRVAYSSCVDDDQQYVSVDLNSGVSSLNNQIQTAAMNFINGLDNGGDPNCGGAGTITSRDNVRLVGGFTS